MNRSRRVQVFLGATLLTIGATAHAINIISVQNEIELGRQAQAELRRNVPEVTDRVILDYVRGVGRQLARRAGGSRYPYSFSVANYREINAFALPGGPVWINRGALAVAGAEAQLAGVLAHEVAHIAERHAAERISEMMIADLGLSLFGALLGDGRGAAMATAAARLGTSGFFLRFSRDDEREADRVGAQMMHRAGWDPRGMIDFLEILRREAGRNPTAVDAFLSSHPSPQNRIELLQETVRSLPGGREDSAAFQTAQRRLRQLPAARSMPRQ
jgi:predicted Zn-dependent protease